MTPGDLPEAAYAAALASLPGVGPAWLFEMLGRHSPSRLWCLVGAGEVARPSSRRPRPAEADWSRAANSTDVRGLWAYCAGLGIQVVWPGASGYPAVLSHGPPAGVIFIAGDAAVLEAGPAVAVVGTRRCTPEGASVAFQLGYDLVAAGVGVVSGLALGIDGAAHAGALAALADHTGAPGRYGSPIGVAASGVDMPYPHQHTALWREVVRAGAVLSETPPRRPAQAWRFPSRNRVIAGLAQMVVVVECHASGGSWHTVDAALRRGTEVGAVPGPVRGSASVGTNMLLHEGAAPIRGAQDVLDALGMFEGPARVPPRGRPAPRARPTRERTAGVAARLAVAAGPRRGPSQGGPGAGPGPLGTRVLGAVGWYPLCLEDIVERSGLPVAAVVIALEALEEEGMVTAEAGWWCRRQG